MAMPIKKSSSGRSNVQHGAPAPGPDKTPPQDQKGMNGSNAAPPNKGGGMAVKKPSASSTVSMPKHAAKSGGKEAPPAAGGGRVGPSRAGESAQPVTAPVAPDVSGGAPSTGAAGASPPMMGGADPQTLIEALLAQAMQGQGGAPAGMMAQPGAQALPQDMPPEAMALLASMQQPNAQLQPGIGKVGLSDLIRRMMLQTGQMQAPQEIMGQTRV